ncbi:4-(cytidine 5'-diphospho)-2-C-methyl-D-erythritol kinase [Marivibrio halodurans]|uniref:4-diphosphocytidyl-2-C-methyl-D-erythritol kinase n=1 Tax=Marivibrio halodurans TaxID=2039722 RepID=A0A8J7V3M0_9PROT|nr:4-(cytidine 5'-diphospho)-2-C-methyl-D-erythritol kinase [Marivibrio halodurans]MBP5858401.1 4-(cytidine 5'-diphospho)-2-C-methyl-D-erythritol kinase [Marivibrio halodurans]
MHDFAAAKLNLTLRILGRRADGYHELSSLVAFADIGDRVSVAPADALTLAIDGPAAGALADLPTDDNLVMRAARALKMKMGQGETGLPAGAALRLEKHLPVASGIGGGSADAAAALRLLSRLWRIAPDPGGLARLALALGADVPVCLTGRPARMEGIGEVVTPAGPIARDPAPGVLLANPGVATPTGAVFAALDAPTFAPDGEGVRRDHCAPLGPTLDDLVAAISPIGNDLSEAACRVTPAIRRVMQALEILPGVAYAALSGSGATCFALFRDRAAAGRAADILRAAEPGWWIAAGRLLSGVEPDGGPLGLGRGDIGRGEAAP